MTEILDDLRRRGLIHDSTDPAALDAALAAGPLVFYVGFDPTAPSLHLGNLLQLVTARRLQIAGHRPLLLVGGSTGLIGDPSGRASERRLNDPAVVGDWVARLRRQVAPFVDTEGPAAATVVDNLEWTAPLSAIDLLRDVGKHFSVNAMLARDAVASRLAEGGISYTEFSYQLLQALDFDALHVRHGCVLQFGGSDQWGNITAGLDYLRRRGRGPCHGFTTPLITRADGTKFGKTAAGTVWLDPDLTSPYAFYQFWLNVEDRDVVRLLGLFTHRDHRELGELAETVVVRPAAREAQRVLATDMTTLVHGAAETTRVAEASRALFGRADLTALDEATLAAALGEAGVVRVDAPLPTLAALLRVGGLASSLGDARRAVGEGGAYLNNVRVTAADEPPPASALLHGRWMVLRRGKRQVAGVDVGGGESVVDLSTSGFDSPGAAS